MPSPGPGCLAATRAYLAGLGTGIDAADVGLLVAAGRDASCGSTRASGWLRAVALRIELSRGLTDAAVVGEVVGSLAAIRPAMTPPAPEPGR